MLKFNFMSLTTVVLMSFVVSTANAEEFFGIDWSASDYREVEGFGYSAQGLSQSMYEAGTSCKRVSNVFKKNELVCIEYRCGFINAKYYISINTYLNQMKTHLSFCHWPR